MMSDRGSVILGSFRVIVFEKILLLFKYKRKNCANFLFAFC
jgi:hypothetical protein